jgi:hypothetical protein
MGDTRNEYATEGHWKKAMEGDNYKRQKGKGKDISVTDRGGSYGCERLKLPHYLDKRLIDGDKAISPTRRPHFTPRFLFLRFLIFISVRG